MLSLAFSASRSCSASSWKSKLSAAVTLLPVMSATSDTSRTRARRYMT